MTAPRAARADSSTTGVASGPESGAPRFARYTLVRTIGEGGNGRVYEALDRQTGATVALKALPALDPTALYRFKREFRALADVAHPNLVTLLDLVGEDGRYCFTMELVDGKDLVTALRPGDEHGLPATAGSPQASTDVAIAPAPSSGEHPTAPRHLRVGGVDPLRVRAAFLALAEGLVALHDAGKLHRDLKPSNVLFTAAGRVVVLDFGLAFDLAAQEGGLTETRRVVGTPHYMAPEQFLGTALGPAADFYAFGVMLFQALTGALPHEGSLVEIMRARAGSPAPELGRAAPPAFAELAALADALLERASDERPSGREVLARLGGGPPAAAPSREGARQAGAFGPAPGRGALFGRDAALATLARAREAAASAATVVLVSGTSGMGKSALVAQFLASSADPSTVVLGARCYERESVPYKALDGVVDCLTRRLCAFSSDELAALLPADAPLVARLFPVLYRVPGLADAPVVVPPDVRALRRRAFAALRALLGALATRSRLVVTVDDLQWGDHDGAAELVELAAGPEAPRALFVLAFRSEDRERSPALRVLAEGATPLAPFATIEVGALAPDDAAELARGMLGPDASAELVARVAGESAGSPFFLGELVRYLGSGAAPYGPAPSLEDVVRARIADLSPDARRLLGALALAGLPLSERSLFAAARLESTAGLRALALLRAGQLARARLDGAGEIEPAHDRIREAACAGLGAEERRSAHAALLEALRAEPAADPEALLFHALGAGDRSAAAHYAERAAERAFAALDFERAAELFRRALELGPEAAPAGALGEGLALALAHSGRSAESAQAYFACLRAAPPERSAELRWRAAEQLLRAGEHDEGVATMAEVLRAAGLSVPRGLGGAIAALLYWRARVRIRGLGFRERAPDARDARLLAENDHAWSAAVGFAGDPLLSALFQARHLLTGLASGDPYRAARASAMEVLILSSQGAAPRRVARLSRLAAELAERSGHPHAAALAVGMDGMRAYLGGDFQGALPLFERALEVLTARCSGVAWELDTFRLFALESLAYLGRISELSRRVPRLVAEADVRGDRYAATMMRTGVQNMVWLVRDDPEGAERELARAEELFSRRGFLVQHFLHFFARVQSALYRGEARRAVEHVMTVRPRMARSLVRLLPFVRICAHWLEGRAFAALAAEAERGSNEQRALARAARKAAKRLERLGAGWAIACAQGIRAGAALVLGDRDAGLALLEAARAGFEALGMQLHEAACRARIAAHGSGAEASELAHAAASWFEREGVASPERLVGMLLPGTAP